MATPVCYCLLRYSEHVLDTRAVSAFDVNSDRLVLKTSAAQRSVRTRIQSRASCTSNGNHQCCMVDLWKRPIATGIVSRKSSYKLAIFVSHWGTKSLRPKDWKLVAMDQSPAVLRMLGITINAGDRARHGLCHFILCSCKPAPGLLRVKKDYSFQNENRCGLAKLADETFPESLVKLTIGHY